MLVMSPHIRSVANQDGAVILDIAQAAMLTLNATGGFIWSGIQAGKSPKDLACELAIATGADLKRVEQDVLEFVSTLQAKGLVTS